MAEFLSRGYNVAVPEVDIGDDIFVVRDGSVEYSKVQVKTAVATKLKNGYAAKYSIRFDQLSAISVPEIWYVFANRLEDKWQSFLIVSRPTLFSLYRLNKFGSINRQGHLALYLSFSDNRASCSGQNFSQYLNNWSDWPYYP